MKKFISFFNQKVSFGASCMRNLTSRFLNLNNRLASPEAIDISEDQDGQTPFYVDEFNVVRLLITAAVQACFDIVEQYCAVLKNGQVLQSASKADFAEVAEQIGAEEGNNLVEFLLKKEGVLVPLDVLKKKAAGGERFLCASKADILVALDIIKLQTAHNFMKEKSDSLQDGVSLREAAEKELADICVLHKIPCRLTWHRKNAGSTISFSVLK